MPPSPIFLTFAEYFCSINLSHRACSESKGVNPCDRAGEHAVVGVVLHFQLATEHVGGLAAAGVEVVTEMVV
ncbi:hypothetical protein BIW19_08945 [Pseudomonas putida]|nr:hypothetical protein WM94_26780 [Pseudomonas sp. ABFPK]OII58186.1 hypothetical protein BIW19_08945 [Pseudomonas putida]